MTRIASVAAICASMALYTSATRADIVTDWNITALRITQGTQALGATQARALAMMHVAMSDAINSVQGRFTRYITTVGAMPNASAEAAAASAARTILTGLFPNQKTIIEEAYAASMKAIPDGESKTQGDALGGQIAAAI